MGPGRGWAARGERMEQPDGSPAGAPMSSARAFAFTAMPVSPVVCLASSALVAAKAIAISRCAAGSSAARRATAHGLSAASDCSTCSSVDSAEPAEPAVSKKDSAMLERYCNHQNPLKF